MSGTELVHPDIHRYIPRTWKPGQPGEEAPVEGLNVITVLNVIKS